MKYLIKASILNNGCSNRVDLIATSYNQHTWLVDTRLCTEDPIETSFIRFNILGSLMTIGVAILTALLIYFMYRIKLIKKRVK